MELNCWVAMTAGEFSTLQTPPQKAGWLSCHFSAYDSGLSNLPRSLPPKSLLFLDDSTPPSGYDPEKILHQLEMTANELDVAAVVLDFQVSGIPETRAITDYLVNKLSCPVCVAAPYAEGLSCPVLAPCPAAHVPLDVHLVPWKGRKIWLELTLDAEQITVTENSSSVSPLPFFQPGDDFHTDEKLCCRYQVKVFEDRAEFTLVRDQKMLGMLLQKARTTNVVNGIGLYQQLK